MKRKKLLLVSNNNLGFGKSGGDTISINLIKFWQKKFSLSLMGSAESKDLFQRYSALPKKFFQIDHVFPLPKITTTKLFINQIRRTFIAIIYFIRHFSEMKLFEYVYTASDFYPDFIIGLLFKFFHPQTFWIAGYYLLAPLPWDKDSPYNRTHQTLRGWIYYLGQIPSKFLIKHFADFVFVTSDPDLKYFSHCPSFVIQGGVEEINFEAFQKSSSYIPVPERRYDAVYMGRFHSQKGVLELIDIWRLVLKKLPDAQLVMIGNGELVTPVDKLIKKYHLSSNITLVGFKDGAEKNAIFQNSKIVVHPAIYDSGGMAAAEAMIWGLPGVSFDLPALKTYYPQGMVKSKINDFKDFSDNIINLLTNKAFYQKTSTAALQMIKRQWLWSNRLEPIHHQIVSYQHEK